MPSFVVDGGHRLQGTVRPAGNKNAALPILAATLLADGPVTLHNMPRIRDVDTMIELLAAQGVVCNWEGEHTLVADARSAHARDPDPVLCSHIRASILLAGPMLARFGRVRLPPPGGDVIDRGYPISRPGVTRQARRSRISVRKVRRGSGQVEQLSMEMGIGVDHDRIRMDGPRLAVDIGQGSARLGDKEGACPGVDGRGPEEDVGRDSAGGQL